MMKIQEFIVNDDETLIKVGNQSAWLLGLLSIQSIN
jgi:hypothetical protein